MLGRKNRYLRKKNTAFTLVELLVAMFIFTIIAAAVYLTFYSGIKLYTTTQNNIRINRKINKVLDRLSLELRNCYGAEYAQNNEKTGFSGDSSSISFFTIKDVYHKDYSGKMPAIITYSFKDNGLFKKIQRGKEILSDSAEFEYIKIISCVKDVNFRYLYFSPERNAYEWLKEWLDKSAIPKGVAVEATLDGLEPIKRYIYISQGSSDES